MRRIQNRDLAARQDLGENEKSWQMDGHIPKYGIKSIWHICSRCPFLKPFIIEREGKGHLQKMAPKQRKK
jgi:hypothetical protein